MERLAIKLRYWKGKLFKIFGLCANCYAPLNFTRNGQGICPYCSKRY